MKTVCIMQPTYLPGPGYFNLIARAGFFVYLDDVQFCPRSWQQRNRILIGDVPHWLTVPVMGTEDGRQRIRDVLTSPDKHWRRKHLRTLEKIYGRLLCPGLAPQHFI